MSGCCMLSVGRSPGVAGTLLEEPPPQPHRAVPVKAAKASRRRAILYVEWVTGRLLNAIDRLLGTTKEMVSCEETRNYSRD